MNSSRSPAPPPPAGNATDPLRFGSPRFARPTISASFSDIATTRANRRSAASQTAATAINPTPRSPSAPRRAICAEQVEGDVVLHQNIAAVLGQLRVLHLQRPRIRIRAALPPAPAASRGDRNSCTSGGSTVHHRGSRYRGFSTSTTRAQNSSTGPISTSPSREREQLDIELARHLAQQMEDPHRPPVRQRKREVGREHRHPPPPRLTRPPSIRAIPRGRHATLALLPRPPPRTQIDPVQRHPRQNSKRRQIQPQMMPLQPRVVRQNLVRSQTIRGAAQRAPLRRQHHRRQPDAIGLQLLPQCRPVLLAWRRSAAAREPARGPPPPCAGTSPASPVQKVTTTASGSFPQQAEEPR